TLAGEGGFDLRDTATDRLKVDMDMTSFRVLGRDDLTALASGDIKVRWARGVDAAVEPLTIGGDITVERLEARIPDQLASDVETIDVTRVSADGEPIDPESDQDASNDEAPIELALNVSVPNSAFVRGRGLESEWSGRLAVAGAVTTPELRGGFQVERGTFDFLGQTFDLSGGRIEFTGGQDIDPYLDVKAVYEDDDFTAIVSLTGLSSDPTLVVTSQPLLPQEEILARVLFGTSTGQLSAIQAVQLADAAATLSGASSGSGVLDTMRRALGVDVLSVGDDGVEVGSYVRDGVYVGVSQGLEAGSGEVSVEVELTDEVSIESGVGTTGDTGVGVTWERDY
ncbi:MAG: translocation/assembly module TamB domain-containing protein, partial [Pseudomonadota bacterium]